MKAELTFFRGAEGILNNNKEYFEILEVIKGITDTILIQKYAKIKFDDKLNKKIPPKSLSRPINAVFKEKFEFKQNGLGWHPEPEINISGHDGDEDWRLDFAKEEVAIEVACNHASFIAHILNKLDMAVSKGIRTEFGKAISPKVGILIAPTESLKKRGGFDTINSSTCSYEKFVRYPLKLTNPLLIIGLDTVSTILNLDSDYENQRRKIQDDLFE